MVGSRWSIRSSVSGVSDTAINNGGIERNDQMVDKKETTDDDIALKKALYDDIIDKLSSITDPYDGDSIVAGGLVSNIIIIDGRSVSFDLINRNNRNTFIDDIKNLCLLELSMLEWVSDIQVNIVITKDGNGPAAVSSVMTVDTTNEDNTVLTTGLSGVKNIIAVSSCKGGVGKSTVAVNLAYTLSEAGARVGILDADIYGPSLPTMTRPKLGDKLYVDNKLVPLEYRGVKLLSLGFINQGASIMRGPMVNQILNQFVLMSDWGVLDYLIIDMPPGTGDIQLTLSQIMNISAAVIVTTPQKLSFVDVVKGIDMFDTVNIPCVAVVENMAEFSTYSFDESFYQKLSTKVVAMQYSPTDEEHNQRIKNLLQSEIEAQIQPKRLFGSGHIQRLKEMWGIENLISLPLLDAVSSSGDKGIPYVLEYPESTMAQALVKLANNLGE